MCPSLSTIEPPQSSVSTWTTSLAAWDPKDLADPGLDGVPIELTKDRTEPASDAPTEPSAKPLAARSSRLLFKGGPISLRVLMLVTVREAEGPCKGDAFSSDAEGTIKLLLKGWAGKKLAWVNIVDVSAANSTPRSCFLRPTAGDCTVP